MKTSGRNAYNAFKDSRATLEREARGRSDDIHRAESRTRAIIERQGLLWTRLSAIHIDAALDLPESVKRSMGKRNERIDETQAEVERVKDRLSALKRKRAEASARHCSTEQLLSDEHAAISARFEADPRVMEARMKIADLNAANGILADKKHRAETELATKRGAYEQDEFFTYLRGKEFGTPRYRSWLPMSRILDARLARKTNYLEENASYERLLAVPGWVDERIAALDPEETRIGQVFSALETEYFGALAGRKSELSERSAELSSVDNDIEAENRAISKANKFLSDAALAEDTEMKRIAADFAAILSRTGFYDLKNLAARTAGTEDDEIVTELQALVDEATTLSRRIEIAKAELYSLERKIKAVEEVESMIRRKGWNDSDHSFRNVDADDLARKLSNDAINTGMVIGMLTSSHVEPRRDEYSSSSGYGGSGASWGSGTSSSSSSNDTYKTTDSFGGSDNVTTTDSF